MRQAIRDDGKWFVKRAIAVALRDDKEEDRCSCETFSATAVNKHFVRVTRKCGARTVRKAPRALRFMRSRVQIVLTKWPTSAIYCQTVLASTARPC